MNISLESIKPSPKPIRTTWDEDKLDELAQSIEEQGLIVPIKVRPANEKTASYISWLEGWGGGYKTDANFNIHDNVFGDNFIEDDDGNFHYPDEQYEIVYGHRRVEAMRIAGYDEIEAIVEGLDDDNTSWQALIENLQREDLSDIDKARGIQERRERGYTIDEIGKRTGLKRRYINYLLALLNEPEDIQEKIVHTVHTGITEKHVRLAREAGLDPVQRKDVIEKAERDKMTAEQTRKVAESVVATKDPKMRERLINAPYSPYTHDPDYARERAERYGEHDPMATDKTPPLDEAWKIAPEVAMLSDFFKKSRQMYQEIIKMDELGKFSPEARPFFVSKLKSTVKQIEKVIERLEG